jgi:arginyl-tRNA synthetase
LFHQYEASLAKAFSTHLMAQGIDAPVSVEQPKDPAFGEFALPVAFQLARQLKKAPRAIAQQIVDGAGTIPGVAALEIAGNGYINVRLDRGAYAASAASAPPVRPTLPGKVIVEHTNINPNKAAHIGHLRNAILGDTFVRMLRAGGNSVEVQNYIDNTGVQVADVVVGFHFIEKKTPGEVLVLTGQPRFDYLCWDLYARVSSLYADNAEAKAWRAETLHAIEANEGALAELGHIVADAIVIRHLTTMGRLGIRYDVLPRESEILHLKFWASAFEQLKERKAIYFETEGKNAGCWVMPSEAFREAPGGDEDSKVIVRSNGTVTYVGKDIAYQMWKFGLLGKDFYYRPLEEFPGVWVSTDKPQSAPAPKFGGATRVYNVIDSRQSYLQDVVVAGLKALHFDEAAANSIHFSYEMVALSPRTCVELGIPLSDEDKQRPYVEVSGRKGLGVKADDLIDKSIDTALAEVSSRHPEATEAERRYVATQIAIGALRYFMLKFTRNTVIAFDLQEALSFEGETGPYVQYAAVRARSILRKLGEDGRAMPDREAFAEALKDEGLWQFLLSASRAETAVLRALESGEPAHVARFAFQLAQSFSGFYHDYPVIAEQDPRRRAVLIWLTRYFSERLTWTLDVLGIPAPPYM